MVGNTKTISNFLHLFLLYGNFLLAHRNRYLEGIEDGQMTSRGHPTFNSYVKNLHVSIGRTETFIRGGSLKLGSLD